MKRFKLNLTPYSLTFLYLTIYSRSSFKETLHNIEHRERISEIGKFPQFPPNIYHLPPSSVRMARMGTFQEYSKNTGKRALV